MRLSYGQWRWDGGASIGSAAGYAAGDLSRQQPIEVTVDLGKPGQHVFEPQQTPVRDRQALQADPAQPQRRSALLHLAQFFSQMVWTRKVQVVQVRDGKPVTLAEFKGAIREIEVYPGTRAEWWFVPVAAGRTADLQCGITDKDGKSHAELGMVGEIVIE